MGREEIISQLWEELKPYCRPETPEPRYAHEIAGDEVAVSGMGCAKLRIGVENGAARVMLGGIVFPLGVQYSSAAAAAQIIFYAQCANNPLWYFSEYILGELVNGDPEREDSVSTLLDYMVKVRNSTSFFSGMRLTPEGFASLGLEPIQANSMDDPLTIAKEAKAKGASLADASDPLKWVYRLADLGIGGRRHSRMADEIQEFNEEMGRRVKVELKFE
jgi:hypothetical protein